MNKEEFSQFYRHNIERIYRFFYLRVNDTEAAEDLTALAFLRMWQEAKKEKSFHIKEPIPFLYRISRNLLVDYYRRKAKQPFSLDQLIKESGLQIPHSGFLDKVEDNLEIERIKKGLEKIKPLYAEVIIWHYLNDLSITQISQILQKKEGTIRVLLHRSLKALRKTLS